MKKLRHIFLTTIFLSCISFSIAYAQTPAITVVYPQENVLQHEFTLNVVVDVDVNNVDKLVISTHSEKNSIDINSSKSTYCKNVSLKLGENRVRILAYKDGKSVAKMYRDVYIKSQIYYQYRFPPKKFKQQFFHKNENEQKCNKCHDMNVNETKGVAFIDITESNCYKCHSNITNAKFGHAPAVNWLCTSCHNGKTGIDNIDNEGKSKYIAPEPVYEPCFECHQKNYKLWDSYRYRHEPLDSGRCNKCHNPHASPYSMFLRKPVDQICLGCHKDKHIKANELDKSQCDGGGRCISCHTPHASNLPFFIKESIESKK